MIKPIKVLVVEDDVEQAAALKEYLEARRDAPFIVEHVTDYPAAKERMRRNGIEIVLLDLRLPRSPPGPDMIQEIKAVAPEIALIVITGWAEPEITKEVKEAGADDLVIKPPDPNRLVGKLIATVLYRRADKKRHAFDEVLDKLADSSRSLLASSGETSKLPPKEST